MHSAAALLYIFAAASTALPQSSVPYSLSQNVSETINSWLNDINFINNFIDYSDYLTTPSAITGAVNAALLHAMDEGTSNSILSTIVTLDASGAAASQALLSQFNVIGPAIKAIIADPSTLHANIHTINVERCPAPNGKGAITNEGLVQQAAASAVGIYVPEPNIPAACSTL